MSSSSATFLGSLARVLSTGARAVVSLKTAWERRRVVGRLVALDDHMLHDIGVTRQDVLSVLAEPLYRDPSEYLAARAAETRRNRRAAATSFYDDVGWAPGSARGEALPLDTRRVA